MNRFPTKVRKNVFDRYILPYLATARRGYVSKVSLHHIFNYILQRVKNGCAWRSLVIDNQHRKHLSWQTVYRHYRKWCLAGCFERVWQALTDSIKIDTSVLSLDGTHTAARFGGENVQYQGRKKSKTTNDLMLTTTSGFVLYIFSSESGNHHDSFQLTAKMRKAFAALRERGYKLTGRFLNADSGFDTKALRKLCHNRGVRPNIKLNPRNRKRTQGRKRLFDENTYAERFTIERTFAWFDSYNLIRLRRERLVALWQGNLYLTAFLINFGQSR